MIEGILCFSLTSPLGPLLVAASLEGVCRVGFGADVSAFSARMVARSKATSIDHSEAPEKVALQFAEYFAVCRSQF
jgi:hypothetical protein